MMLRLALVSILFLLVACEESGFHSERPKAEEIEPCDCVPPPTKTLPEERLNAVVVRLTRFAELMEVLAPESRGFADSAENHGLQEIVENCLLVHKKVNGEKADQILEYIQTENRAQTVCPVSYRQETLVTVSARKPSLKGRHRTNFRSENRELSEKIGLSQMVLTGPYFKIKREFEREDHKVELLQLEFSQKGFIFFPDIGRIDTKVIQRESKEILTDAQGHKSFGDIAVGRYLIWELDDEFVVFHWNMTSSGSSQESVVECRVNGADVSESRLCEIF